MQEGHRKTSSERHFKKKLDNPVVNHQKQVQSFENSMGEVIYTCENFLLNFKLNSILCSCSKNDKGMPQIHTVTK